MFCIQQCWNSGTICLLRIDIVEFELFLFNSLNFIYLLQLSDTCYCIQSFVTVIDAKVDDSKCSLTCITNAEDKCGSESDSEVKYASVYRIAMNPLIPGFEKKGKL